LHSNSVISNATVAHIHPHIPEFSDYDTGAKGWGQMEMENLWGAVKTQWHSI